MLFSLFLDKIKDLLQPGVVNGVTRLVLVNAIYFKGNWMHIFETRNTKEMPFKINQVQSAFCFRGATAYEKCI